MALFADQLEAELAHSSFEKVENNRLYMKQGRQGAFAESQVDRISEKQCEWERLPADGL